MNDLPEDRCTENPLFTIAGKGRIYSDLFGPYFVKIGKSTVKRYGVIFSCQICRAVHPEKMDTMGTDSFINACRRFTCRRGKVRVLRSDCGSQLLGARNEFQKAARELDNTKIKKVLAKEFRV